jgi:hypothetical protein
MLSDLTFEMCVPSFLCIDPQRIQRKMPSYRRVSLLKGFIAP